MGLPFHWNLDDKQVLLDALIPTNRLPDLDWASNLTPESFRRDYLASETPVVIRDAMADWPCFTKWSAEFLRKHWGSREIPVSTINPTGRQQDDATKISGTTFIDTSTGPIGAGTRYYINTGNIVDAEGRFTRLNPEHCVFADLADDIRIPSLIPGEKAECNIWGGAPNTVTNLHWDVGHNFLALLRGTKTIVLIAPDQSPNLYQIKPWDPGYVGQSEVDVAAPDLRRYPRFARAQYRLVTLGPGEMLFIPGGHWHYVLSEGFNLALNYWWGKGARITRQGLYTGASMFYRRMARVLRNEPQSAYE